MDLLSLAVGFVVGAFTGAAGNYLGEKYTGKRKSKELIKSKKTQWEEVERKFPKVILEMKEDVKKHDFQNVREFFVKSSKISINREEPCFEYFTDVHQDIKVAVKLLEDLGFIQEITSNNCPMYRMKEHFVELLRNS